MRTVQYNSSTQEHIMVMWLVSRQHGILHNIVNYVILQLHGSGCENALAHRDDRSTVCYLKYTLVWILCAFTG